jgi:type IV secretory pathway VirJ component
MAQAPGNTFAGGISLGFCPDLETPKPLCKGAGLTWKRQKRGFVYDPVKHLQKPWIALQGGIDQVCDPPQTRVFVEKVPNGKIVELPNVGHGFSVFKNWMPQFKAAYRDVTEHPRGPTAGLQPPAAAVSDLPLIEVPAKGRAVSRMAVFFSGDGGWADLDQRVSAVLAANGLPVVGVNSLKYFWKKRSAEETAADLERIIGHYARQWGSSGVVLVGYSFGADVMPFLVSRLPRATAEKVELIALLGPSRTAEFEFHVTGWAGGSSATAQPVEPEMRKLSSTAILCLYGDQEEDSLCKAQLPGKVRVVSMKGAHHFGGDYERIGREILEVLKP